MHLAGRLSFYYNQWLQITNDKTILSWVRGYSIPLIEAPVQYSIPSNNKGFSNKECLVIENCISDMLKKNVISICLPCEGQFISPVFTIPKPNGKHRFILNLKQLNKFVLTDHFKMEDHRTALKLLDTNYYMATIDLQDAYFLISITKSDRKLLRFLWNSQLYEFNVLPFGLCTAPYVFTKLLKPIMYYLRSAGLISVNYLDDFLCIGKTFDECYRNVKSTMNLLKSLGFVVNMEKSQLYPCTQCKFLGFIFDTCKMTLSLPEDKKRRILDKTEKMITTKVCSIRHFAEYIGLLTSACPAVLYGWVYSKLFEREKFFALNGSDEYDRSMNVPTSLHCDMKWWSTNIMSSYCPIRKNNYVLEIYTDASLTGWGAVCNGESTGGNWKLSEKSLHINTLELKAAFKGLQAFATNLTNCEILLRVDNTTAICYINRMGGIQHENLNKVARDLWLWCEKRRIYIFASYIQSSNNIADEESRKINIDTEWELADFAYNQIINHLGTPEFDLFANIDNFKCSRYASWKMDPGAEIIDAFTFHWGNLNFYAFPPFSLISKVLQKIVNDRAEGIMVVPKWPSQPWYPVWHKLLVSPILTFVPNKHLLFSPYRHSHPLSSNLILVAAKLSGRRY